MRSIGIVLEVTLLTLLFTWLSSMYLIEPIYQAEASIELVGMPLLKDHLSPASLRYLECQQAFFAVAESDELILETVNDLRLGWTLSYFRKVVNLEAKALTPAVTITAENTEPERCQELILGYLHNLEKHLKNNSLELNIHVMGAPMIPQGPARPDLKQNQIRSIYGGFLTGLLINFIDRRRIRMEQENAQMLSFHTEFTLFWKRPFDVVASLIALVLASPLMILIILLIRITSQGPIFFIHKRVGLSGREFPLYKFRTMVQNAESLKSQFTPEQQAEFLADYKLKEDPRVTKIGRFLRKTSLDELPQLFNVLRGDMSLIGPRPVTQEELSKYDGFVNLLLSVRPGITGLWQVSGRNDISYEERVQLDINYILNCNWAMDCKLMLDTIRVMLFRLGAY